MSVIEIKNLTFAYDGSYDNVFENACFRIDTDWKLGFIGRNGRGKTTLLNLLMGRYEYRGQIISDVEFMYFPYNIADMKINTAQLAFELEPETEFWQFQKELSLLGVDDDVLERDFITLSGGERLKVMLALLFSREDRFLLIDEPTNHLDADGRRKVAQYLKSKKGFILVSHDRDFVDECVDHILSINKANIEVQSGNFSSWFHNKEMQDNFEMAKNESLRKSIKQLETAAKRTANWSDKAEKGKRGTLSSGLKPDKGYVGHKAEKMMQRAKNLQRRQEQAIGEKSALLKNIEHTDELKIHPLKYHADTLVYAKDLSINYDDNVVCKGFNLDVRKGDKIALCGKNGCGKTSLLKLILGENISHSGTFHKGSGLKISYLSQYSDSLSGNLRDYAIANGIDESLFKAILRKLELTREDRERNIENMSEGQKKKVMIAHSLCESAHLYIWDEPLNYIDIFSRMQIEELIKNNDMTMIFVEHDSAFVRNTANKIIQM
ncbi:MAG: ABC-F type ribosomal protection protein [Clostridia bacterium]|nr:ABC-F type ribosomal protection protein [Clostridia bacterium]